MSDSEPPIGDLPSPPRLPRPMPDEGKAGWWVTPGWDPRTVRYHDGDDWTAFVCRLGLRGPGDIERDPMPPSEDPALSPDPAIRELPAPPRHPTDHPEATGPPSGWFLSGFGDERKNPQIVRYMRDRQWTEFACEVIRNGVGPIHRRPHPKVP